MQIKVEHLSYVYSEKSKDFAVKALDDVSMTVEEGDFLGIIGHTGSGKSTFVQHVNGLIRIGKDKGKLTVGEFDLADKKCDLKKLRSKVGMVFQYPEHQLFAETVFEDVAFGVKNFYPKYTQEEIESAVRASLEIVGLPYEKYKDKSPFDLSGGQKRRVAIAGVVAYKPEILVLDEPAAGLDPVGKREFIALLHTLKEKVVKTIIIVSHDMNLIADNCNKVAVFNKGKLHAFDTPKNIFSDYEGIEKLGLDLPVTAYLERQMKKSGIRIESDLTQKDFVEKVAELYKGGKG